MLNESSTIEDNVSIITDKIYTYTKDKFDTQLKYQEDSINEFKSFIKELKKNLSKILGKDYVKDINIRRYTGNQYSVELQKYMIEIVFPMYYFEKSTNKKYYADGLVKEELKSDKYKNIRKYDFYRDFYDNMVQLVSI